jgi:hypothetical protein
MDFAVTVMPNGKNPEERLAELIAANVARLDALSRSGIAVDTASLIHARIDALIDSVASAIGPAGPLWAVTARISFETAMAAEFDRIEAEAQRIVLAQGAMYTPAMIAELARQTGTFEVKRRPGA